MCLLHDLISQKQKVAMFSADPFSVQRGLCAITKYNGSTDSTNYDNSQHRLGTQHNPWSVDLCTQSVVCRLVHTIRGVSTCAVNLWCVDLCSQSVVCRLVQSICGVSTCALLKCHAALELIFNNAIVHVKTGVCVSVSVLTEQFTTDLYQSVISHRTVHNRSVSVTA